MRQVDKRRIAAALDEQAAREVPAGVDLRPAIHVRLGIATPPSARVTRQAGARQLLARGLLGLLGAGLMVGMVLSMGALFQGRSQGGAGGASSAPPKSYFGPYAPPFPLPVVVHRGGRALTITPADGGYQEIVGAGTAILSDLWAVKGRLALPAGAAEVAPAYGVEFVYVQPAASPSVLFDTTFGRVTLERVFLLLDPALDAPATIWASSADGGWIEITSRRDRAGLKSAVEQSIAGRQDWGPPPTPPGQGPPPSPTALPPLVDSPEGLTKIPAPSSTAAPAPGSE